jgi:hypothetical protein
MRAFIQSSQTHIQHEGKIMVQKIVIVKDGTEQNPIPLNMDSSGNLGVNITTDVVPVSGYMHNAATTAQTGTVLTVTGCKMLAISVNALITLASFTLSFEASVDGTNYVPLTMVTNIADDGDYTSVSGTPVASAAAFNAGYTMMCAGFKYVRTNIRAITLGAQSAGSVTVFGRAVA